MRRTITIVLIAASTVVLAGCFRVGQAKVPPAPSTTTTDVAEHPCLKVSDDQAQAISEGLKEGVVLTDWAAMQADTGPGAWFVTAQANGPGIENEPFVFFTSVDPEHYTAGTVKAADNVTAAFVDWPMQEGAILDDSFDAVKDCGK